MVKLKLGFLASHGGSNMQAIIDACKNGTLDAEPSVVISNNSESGALKRAEKEGIPYYHLSLNTHPEEQLLDDAIVEVFEEYEINIVILAGYMKKIGRKLLTNFKGRILNIHPALLPKFGGYGMYGMKVHEAVLKADEKITGPTVHLVDEHYDHGRILAQKTVPIFSDDTPETLAARVLEQEHTLYPETIQKIITGKIILEYE